MLGSHLDDPVGDLWPGDGAQLALGQAQLVGGEGAQGGRAVQVARGLRQVPGPEGRKDGQVGAADHIPGGRPSPQRVQLEQHLRAGRAVAGLACVRATGRSCGSCSWCLPWHYGQRHMLVHAGLPSQTPGTAC